MDLETAELVAEANGGEALLQRCCGPAIDSLMH